jgi:subtilase family serine protease
LAGTHPSWASAGLDKGGLAATRNLSIQVYLAGRDPAGLAAYAAAVSNPGSAAYHRYLTPAAELAAFGPTTAQVAAVEAWLKGDGLAVTATTQQYVAASGSVAALDKAFGTRIDSYATSSGTRYAPASDATIPAAVSSAVLGVAGLSSPTIHESTAGVAAGGATYIGPTCSSYYGQKTDKTDPAAYGRAQPYAVCGYVPSQLQSAYGVKGSGLTGKGVTVAITDAYASPTMRSDANTYSKSHGQPTFTSGQYTEVYDQAAWTGQSTCGGTAGWAGEQSIDVEAVHATAPGANIVYYGANSCNDADFLKVFANIVDTRSATLVSDSWGEVMYSTSGNLPQALVDEYEQIFEQGAVEGIGFYFSSGDCANEDPNTGCGANSGSIQKQTDYPNSDPWATAVGGTSLAVGKSGNYQWETAWGTDETTLTTDGTSWANPPGTFAYGSGGGTSSWFTQPWYQKHAATWTQSHVLLSGATSKTAMRTVPDVSALADPWTGMLIGQTQPLPNGTTGYGESAWGGTSLACPLFVGLQADAQQEQGGVPIGFANPAIYERYGSVAYHDVTDTPLGAGVTFAETLPPYAFFGNPPILATLAKDHNLPAVPGYDLATGVGSPSLEYLASYSPSWFAAKR